VNDGSRRKVMSCRTRTPLLAAVLTLAVLVVTSAGAAAYGTLRILRQTSQGKITFEGGLVSVGCNLTLTGEVRAGPFTSELPIVVGQVNRLDWRECSGGTITEILGLPWLIQIVRILEARGESRIAGIRPEAVTGFVVSLVESGRRGENPIGFSLELLAIECLYGGRGEAPSALTPLSKVRETRATYTLEALTVLESVRFRKAAGLETCPGEGIIRGRFSPAEPARTATFG